MHWAEIEQSAASYRKAKQAKTSQVLVEREPIPIVDAQQIQIQKQVEVDEILHRFRVRECLETIGREVWREGDIKQYGGIYTNIFCKETISLTDHLVLASDEISEIQVSTPEKEYKPSLIIARSGVGLGVRIHYGNSWELEVTSWSIYNLDKQPPNLIDALIKHGLSRALRESLTLDNMRLVRGQCFERNIKVNNRDPEGKFHQALEDLIAMMRENNSFPKQVRTWCQERVNQLPANWPKGEWIEFDQLLKFAYQVRETPNFLKTLHRLTDYRFV